MNQSLRLSFVVPMMLAAVAVSAGSGVDLSVVSCPGEPGALGGVNYALDCAGRSPVELLVTWAPAESVSDLAAIDVAMHYTVDSGNFSTGTFWNFDPGGCHDGGLTSSHVRPAQCAGPVSYADIWNGGSAVSTGRRDANGARMAFTCYNLSPVAVAANARLFGARIVVDMSAAAEAGGACTGCCLGSDITLEWCQPDAFSNRLLTTRYEGTGTVPGFVPWLALWGTRASCQPVGVRRHTWGQLKSLYR